MSDALHDTGISDSLVDGAQCWEDVRATTRSGGQYGLVEPLYKRPFDFILALVGLVLSSPIWVLVAIAIIIEDGFPVMIKQCRIGRHGRYFASFKFRSMIKESLRERVNIQACDNDPRITKVGRVLRACALDELPQLLNILIGDMSFVGPRALLPNEIEINGDSNHCSCELIPGYTRRIAIRPGLTGIAQVYAPRDIPRQCKFRYDLLYKNKMGLLIDVKLIIISFLVSFSGAWEKRCAKLLILEKNDLCYK
jgi:lipopolysaccharide/colanic/teichoic acid biosynthesis glycosyltransferase